MARPKGNVATAAWSKFASAREAHFVHGAPAAVLHAAAADLNRWADRCDLDMGPDFGACADLPSYGPGGQS